MKIIGIVLFLSLGIIGYYQFFQKQKHHNTLGENPSPKAYGYINPKALSKAIGDVFNFSLLDQNGNYFELYRLKKFQEIILIAIKPNAANLKIIISLDHKIKLDTNGKRKYYFIYPGNNISRSSISEFALQAKLTTPILLDSSQEISRLLKLQTFYDAKTIRTQNWSITESSTRELVNLLANIEKEKLVYDFKTNRDFEREVAPIIRQKCLNCHSTIAQFPPSLDQYAKFIHWNDMSKETILNGRMPPIGADAFFGDYQDNNELSPQEKKILLQWFDQKKPTKLTGTDPLKNPKILKHHNPKYPFIYETGMDQPAAIAPGGQMEYGYVQLGGPVPFDIWFAGVEVTSTNPRQLHHEAIMITSQPLELYRQIGIKKFHITQNKLNRNFDGDIVLYTLRAMRSYEMKNSPGTYFRSQVWGAGKPQPFYFGNNNLAYIPKGYYIIMENHYMGTGKNDTEKTRIKFFGFKSKPNDHQRLHSYTLTTNEFTIPAHAENYVVETPTWEITEDIKFTNFLPHLHMRGSSVKLYANNQIIYSAPNFNYGWQTGFIVNLKKPIVIKKGTKVKAVCTFDNSEFNPFNPDPNKNVNFGQRLDRTEMCKVNTNFILTNKTKANYQIFKPINKKINPQDFYEE